jgi:exonuclease SbcD
MRLLHTSDWHLGRTLHGVDLLGHQSAFLDHLVEVVRAERVDAVLVAGDVYDRAIPPVEAVALLSDALARLADLTTVVITPGNHDSAARLGFGSALMRERIRIVATPADLDRPVVLDGPDERVLVYGLPYLDPDVARHTLAVGDAPLPRSHAAVLGAAMDRVRADLAVRRAGAGQTPVRAVVLAHAFVVGGAASESERDIRVGGVDHAPTSTFDGVDYVALGHLHGPQRVGAAEGGTVLRYAGSPLAYSFSEAGHTKSVALVDLGPDGPAVSPTSPAPWTTCSASPGTPTPRTGSASPSPTCSAPPTSTAGCVSGSGTPWSSSTNRPCAPTSAAPPWSPPPATRWRWSRSS